MRVQWLLALEGIWRVGVLVALIVLNQSVGVLREWLTHQGARLRKLEERGDDGRSINERARCGSAGRAEAPRDGRLPGDGR